MQPWNQPGFWNLCFNWASKEHLWVKTFRGWFLMPYVILLCEPLLAKEHALLCHVLQFPSMKLTNAFVNILTWTLAGKRPCHTLVKVCWFLLLSSHTYFSSNPIMECYRIYTNAWYRCVQFLHTLNCYLSTSYLPLICHLMMTSFWNSFFQEMLKSKVTKPYSPIADGTSAEVTLKEGICTWSTQQVPGSAPISSSFGSSTDWI